MKNYRKSITQNDLDELHNALPKLENLWGPHNIGGNGPVSEKPDNKCTIWLQLRNDKDWRRHNNNQGVVTFINIIEKYLSDIYKESKIKLGRVYIHRLRPGITIDRHKDVSDQPYFSVCNRYQFFINIPENITIESVPAPEENSFFWFNHHEWHYYKNNGTEPLIFWVIDVVPDTLELK
jgi:hypothetical protein